MGRSCLARVVCFLGNAMERVYVMCKVGRMNILRRLRPKTTVKKANDYRRQLHSSSSYILLAASIIHTMLLVGHDKGIRPKPFSVTQLTLTESGRV